MTKQDVISPKTQQKLARRYSSGFFRSPSTTGAADFWYHALVWVNLTPPGGAWEQATVLSASPLEEEWIFEVRLEDGSVQAITSKPTDKHNLEFEYVKRRDAAFDAIRVDDMTSLAYLNEPEIVRCLQERYRQQQIYTNTGPILMALNPLQKLPIYTKDILQSYYIDHDALNPPKLPPHVFQVANRAYSSMFVDRFDPDKRENQAILVNGESGAGKTQSTKYVLHFLAVISSEIASQHVQDDDDTDIENQIVASYPIMESFGNAKTLRNDNSSRFGKFIELLYTSDGYISGGIIRTYLLETVRVAHQNKGERNYHIFYEAFAALTPPQQHTYGVSSLANFRYTNQSGVYTRSDGESDENNYYDLRDAMCTLNIPEDTQDEINNIIFAILHIGNLSFVNSSHAGEDGAEFSGDAKQHVKYITHLLGISEELLLTALARRSVTIVGNTIVKTLNSELATAARDTFAKFAYGLLFEWVMAQINAALHGRLKDDIASFIGVLDIFGFEHFQSNSFEQLCINYTNEKLQDHFNFAIFKSEQEVYQAEGLKWTFVKYPDNSERLDLIENSSYGILSMCTEQLKIPKSTDAKLANCLYQKCASHPYFVATRADQGKQQFVVRHFACDVRYDVDGFLEKNRTEVAKELIECLQSSSSSLVSSIAGMNPDPKDVGGRAARGAMLRAPSVKEDKTIPRKDSKGTSKFALATRAPRKNVAASVGKKNTSVASEFQVQLSELIAKVRSTRSHFIRCIKPNAAMVKAEFDVRLVTDQLRCGGALGAVQVFRAGFPNRMSYAAFVNRFSGLAFVSGANPMTRDLATAIQAARTGDNLPLWKAAASRLIDIVPMSEAVLNMATQAFMSEGVDVVSGMQLGKTLVFLQAAVFEHLERLIMRVRSLTARRLQIRFKAWKLSKTSTNIKTYRAMMAAQEAMRYFSDYRRLDAMQRVSATVLLQRRVKIFLAVQSRKWIIATLRSFQNKYRLYIRRLKRYRQFQASAVVVQAYTRRYLVQQRKARNVASAIAIQRAYKCSLWRSRFNKQSRAKNRGHWSVVKIQSLWRAMMAERRVREIRREMIAKQFEDQMKAAQRRAEIMANLQKSLEANPNLLDDIHSSHQVITTLREQVATLKKRIAELETQNYKLVSQLSATQKALNNSSITAPPTPDAHHSQDNVISNHDDVDELLLKVDMLQRENTELKLKSTFAPTGLARLQRQASDPGSPSVTPPGSMRNITDAPTPVLGRLSPAVSDEHPDWVKKFSDQHKRHYWKHKVTGKKVWTAPAIGSTDEYPDASSTDGDHKTDAKSSDSVSIGIERLIAGWLVLRLTSSHFPKERTIRLDPSSHALSWAKGEKVEGAIHLERVTLITRGKKSLTLEKAKGLDPNLCLSLHYSKTSLDMQCASEAERDLMFHALSELIGAKHHA